MKPPSIQHFDQFYLGGLAVVLLGSWINVEHVHNVQLSTGASKVGAFIALGLYAFIFGALWYMASVKRGKVAKWILIAVCGFMAFSAVISAIGKDTVFTDSRSMVLVSIGYAIEGIGFWKLFAPDAKWWFGDSAAAAPPPAYPPYDPAAYTPPPAYGQQLPYPPAGYAPPAAPGQPPYPPPGYPYPPQPR